MHGHVAVPHEAGRADDAGAVGRREALLEAPAERVVDERHHRSIGPTNRVEEPVVGPGILPGFFESAVAHSLLDEEAAVVPLVGRGPALEQAIAAVVDAA